MLRSGINIATCLIRRMTPAARSFGVVIKFISDVGPFGVCGNPRRVDSKI